MSSRKRKHVSQKRKRSFHHMPEEGNATIDPALYVQAYEADIIRGPRGHVAALSLEVRNVEGETDVGSGLIRLGEGHVSSAFLDDDWEDNNGEGPSHFNSEAVWVDRYDARLLLDPQVLSSAASKVRHDSSVATPSSPTGWSDLPSDAEDTFFFTAEETEDYKREKRRRMMEQTRDERLKARMREDGEEIWGESDEEPEESQREIMRRTAKSILASPNPAQLELRILANHGSDARFAFLRGRWSRIWKSIQERAKVDKLEQEQKTVLKSNSLRPGLVADYDSDESREGDGVQTDVKEESEKGKDEAVVPAKSNQTVDEAGQELRRVRAREWMASRRMNATK